MPFRVLGRQILTDPKETLGRADDVAFAVGVIRLPRALWTAGAIDIAAVGSQAGGKAIPLRTIRLNELPYAGAMTFTGRAPARDLAPDYYELRFMLKDGQGEAVDEARATFILSPETAVPHPVTIDKPLTAASRHLYYYGLAIQYDKRGDLARAEALLEKAREMKPGYLEGAVQFADLLIRAGKPDRALELAEELAGAESFRFDRFLIRGRALKDKGEYAAAIQALLEGNKIYNSDTRLLNALGFCFYKTGQKSEALDALAASLRLDPGQKEIEELRGRVEKELK
jgi:tetratricopeptide (TPR) repeat protein